MAFTISPGVSVSEIDLTTVVPSVLTTAGAFAGSFRWGPVNVAYQVSNEIILANKFGTPDTNTSTSFFTAASFLAYGNNLQLVRAANTLSYNATSGATLQVQNESVFQYNYLNNTNGNTYGSFIARYPGALGNSLTVSVADSNTFNQITGAGTITTSTSSTTVSGLNTYFTTDVTVGSFLTTTAGAILGQIASITNDTTLTLVSNANFTFNSSNGYSSGIPFNINWQYASYFTSAPSTSASVAAAGGLNDELHVIVVDSGGLFTGTKGTVLETFAFVSKASDAYSNTTGVSNYYKNVIFNNSQYVYSIDHPEYAITSATWGKTSSGTNFTTLTNAQTVNLSGGTDVTPSDSDIINAYGQFTNKDVISIDLVLTGGADSNVQQYVINNVAAARADCVAFVSPPYSAVVQKPGNEVSGITTWINSLAISSPSIGSYVVADCGWKYLFDKYNNTYRWVPLNADIAGLCVYTDSVRDPWWSPAGYNRGNLKNVIKLAWNPNQTQRDTIYSIGVNPVVTFPGSGTILYGDKTLQSKPSAFDRINVRRLFIVLEKTISLAAKYSLFEFNDAFTQSQFVSLVTPYLRDVQGRRGITAFKVVCDSTNNTPQVVNSNQFVGDIYIQPARSINFIQLNFIAVASGVTFNEVVGSTGV